MSETPGLDALYGCGCWQCTRYARGVRLRLGLSPRIVLSTRQYQRLAAARRRARLVCEWSRGLVAQLRSQNCGGA